MSVLLNTKLDKDTLVTCVQMIENGANPEALAVRSRSHLVHSRINCGLDAGQEVVRELRRESLALQADERENGKPTFSAR